MMVRIENRSNAIKKNGITIKCIRMQEMLHNDGDNGTSKA